MKKFYLTTFILLIVSTLSYAQLPEKAVGRPEVFDVFQNETKIESIITSSRYFKSGKIKSYWKVFSDRDNNTTFDKPDGSKKQNLGIWIL